MGFVLCCRVQPSVGLTPHLSAPGVSTAQDARREGDMGMDFYTNTEEVHSTPIASSRKFIYILRGNFMSLLNTPGSLGTKRR